MGRNYYWISEKNNSTHPFKVFYQEANRSVAEIKSFFKTREKAVRFIIEQGYTEYCERTDRFYKTTSS